MKLTSLVPYKKKIFFIHIHEPTEENKHKFSKKQLFKAPEPSHYS